MQAAILWPVIAQATLTFAVLIIMGMRRRRALADSRWNWPGRWSQVAASRMVWPRASTSAPPTGWSNA